MIKSIRKNLIKIIGISVTVVVFLIVMALYSSPKFKNSECAEGLDGYVWHVNDYRRGKYYAMGWQKSVLAWGNEIYLDKSTLERERDSVPFYAQAECPIFGSSK